MTIERTEPVARRPDEPLDELQSLRRAIETLERRVSALEGDAARVPSATAEPAATATTTPASDDSVWSWLGTSAVLPRVAMVCFVLVVALALRTLTDNGIIGLGLGVMLGVTYSVGLVAWGWRLMVRARRGRRVLPVCGVVLLCTVLLEAHGAFGLISAPTASWGLLAALAGGTALGLRHRSAGIVAFSALAPALGAMALGFPNLSFPHAAAVLLAANGVAFLASRLPRMQWLSWVVFGLSLFYWVLWGFKVHAALRQPGEPAVGLSVAWFLPLVGAFAAAYAAMAMRRAIAPANQEAFAVFLPTANVLWAWPAAKAALGSGGAGLVALAAVAGATSLAHFGFAALLRRRRAAYAASLTSFVVAGSVLFTLATPALLGVPAALPAWALLALVIARCSVRCDSIGLRLGSYLLQVVTCGAAIVSGLLAVPAASLVGNTASALLVVAFAGAHYRFVRRNAPASESWFARVDAADRAAIVTLWAAAIAAFGVVRLLTYRGIELLGAELENTFEGMQSVIVNCAGIALLLWSTRTRDRQVLATGVLVGCYGGLRVFGSNLLNGHGVPLVLAVFSFGVAAAVASIVLRKWQGGEAE